MATLASLNPLAALGLGEQQPATPPSYDELLRRRAMAVALAGRRDKGFPKTLGEGMTYLGEAVGERMNDADLRKKEAAFAAAEDARLAGLKGAPGTAADARVSAADPLDKVAHALLGQGGDPLASAAGFAGGVPQQNPTLAEALPPQEAGGPQPNVQLAALGGAGGTMTDAPPPGAGVPAPPVSDVPEPTPTDIRPMPVKTVQVGPGTMAGAMPPLSGGFRPTASDLSPTAALPAPAVPPVAGPRPPGAVAPSVPAGDTLPSMTAVPPQREQVMPDPGPEPQPPPRIGMSKRQQQAIDIMNHRNTSDYGKAFAKQQFDIDEKMRTEMNARREADYVNRRERWERADLEKKKFDREAHDRSISQLKERLGIETTQAGLENTRIDLAKKYHERDGGGWDTALEKAKNDVLEQQQKLRAGTAPPHVMYNDKIAQWDQESRTYKIVEPTKLPTADDRPDVKLSETQAKTFDNLQKAEIGFEQFKRIRDVDKVLAEGLQDELAGKIPFFGNAALTSRYRRARNAALNIVTAHLRETSGAVIGPSEEASHIANMFPKFGDDDAVIKQKRQILEGVVGGMRLKLGRAGELADYASAKRTAADAADQAKIREEMKGVGVPVVGKIYEDRDKNGRVKARRYWTGSRWEDD